MTAGQQLVKWRRATGRTQAGLALELGVQARSVQNWESEKARPQYVTQLRLLQLAGIPMDKWRLKDGAPDA